MNIILPDKQTFTTQFHQELLDGVVVIQTESPVVITSNDGLGVHTENKKITAIPYYSWANRGKGEMQVWLPRKIIDVNVNNN